MRTWPSEASGRQRRRAAVAFWLLCGPGLGVASLGAAVIASGVRFCWPRPPVDAGCLGLLGAGVLCWSLPLTAGTVMAWQWLRAGRSLAAVLRRYPAEADARLHRLAVTLGLGEPVTRSADRHVWAATYGLVHPRIALSAGLCDRLSDTELTAVLLHEAQHRRSRDPLRLLLARSARVVLGPLPAAGRVLRAFLESCELAADAHAMDQAGRYALASALWRLGAADLPPGGVAFAPAPSTLLQRVAQIERYPAPLPGSGPNWRDIAALGAGVAVTVAWSLLCLRA
jgi:beta-lactamase regulating signal transducer with metallopeptidase domain